MRSIHHCGDSLSGIGGVKRPGIVHRLDKETSGVMVIAKTDAAHRALSEAFAAHGRAGDLERAYVALVWGIPARMAGHGRRAARPAADRVGAQCVPETGTTRATPSPITQCSNISAKAAPMSPGLARRMPAGNRAYPSNPRAYGPYRPPGDRRPGLRPGVPHQGEPIARGHKGARQGVSAAGAACLAACVPASPHAMTMRFEARCRGHGRVDRRVSLQPVTALTRLSAKLDYK